MRVQKVIGVVLLCGCLQNICLMAREEPSQKLLLTLDDYTKLVLRQSDRARVAYNNFKNSINSYKISYRDTRLPNAEISATAEKGESETENVTTESQSKSASLSLTQPFYPTGASISAGVSSSLSNLETGGAETETKTDPQISAAISQPLYLFVGNAQWRRWKRAEIAYFNAEESYKQTVLDIKNEARAKYFSVIQKRESLEVETFKFQSAEQAFKITKAMVNAGRYAGVELSRAEVRLEGDRRNIENAKTDLQMAINEALDYAALNIQTDVQFLTSLSYTPLSIPLKKLLEYAYRNRPDYLTAQKQLELSELSLKETRESNNLALTAQAGLTSTKNETLSSSSKTDSWYGGLNLSWPLFDSGISSLNVESAKMNLENDRIAFKELERRIETQVSNAHLEISNLERQMDDLKKSKEMARKTVSVVHMRYKNGLDRLIDVFDSENSYRDTELKYINTIISANLAKDRLAELIGGPLEEVGK